ncbi:MAG: hypothetical protein IKJ63_04420 [Clostridia bacterium]|nr:hypothetical protein [Clostridia bacterium]
MSSISIINWTVTAMLLGGFASAVCYAVKKPHQRDFGIATALPFAVCSIYSIYCSTGTRLVVSPVSVCFAVGLFFMSYAACYMIRYKNCSLKINATYISCKKDFSSEYSDTCTPLFFYVYKDKEYRQYSFISFQENTHNKLYKRYDTYTIFIDPEKPYNCVDKRVKPINAIAPFLLIGSLFLIFSVILFIIL